MHYKKKELLHMLETLEKVNQVLGKASPRKLVGLAEKNVFVDCQQTAIEIGTDLENRNEDTKVVVAILEDYCEAIYQASIKLDDANECRKLSKKMKKQLVQAQNVIKNKLWEDKKEVVFFPYKASMWDSLECIWMTIKEEPECDTYVIPIPYFDKNTDGSLREMHYEGSEYPDYVPITDWQKYDMAEHRPDEVYIHNPYDQFNYVTTVHPDFYAARLKQYTDNLVYCPYFVSVNNQVSEHFCTLPGVFYSDKIFVESRNVRNIYINAIRKYEKENNCIGQFGDLNKKIQVSEFGSPKLERVRRITKEELRIPLDWECLIHKKSEAGRKIILYNTTIDSALKYSGEFLEKVREVLAIFRNSDDVVLLWRPHPLLLSTLYSMRPDLYQGLLDIVEAYRKEEWGIYDDSADVDRAIVLSSAYYGDWSSLVTLYKTTGKPIMIANYEE